MKVKKVIIGICIVVLIALFGGRAWYLYSQKEPEKTNEKVIKIGAILPLSSNVAKTANESLESLKIAERHINNNPQYPFKVKLIVEDGKHQPKASLSAFHKLMAQKIDTLIVFADIPAKAIDRFIEDSKIQTLFVGTSKCNPYMFAIPVSNATLAYTYGKYVVEKMNLKHIAIIQVDDLVSKETVEDFTRGVHEKGGKITSIEKFKNGAIETKTQVLKALDKNPDAVFVYAFGDDAFPSTINYLREMKYEKPILSLFVITEILPYLKSKDNLYFLDLTLQDGNNPDGYSTAFRQKFKTEPNMIPTFHYIAANMIANIASRVGTENPELFMKELKMIPSFETPYGQMKIIDEKTYLPMFAKKVLPDGTIEVIEEIKE